MVVRGVVIVGAAALYLGLLAASAVGMVSGVETGRPDRGRAVYFGPGGCANCHAASADPTQPSTGPQLTVESLRAHAADAGKPLADYVAESILVPNAYAAAGYVSGIMQPPRGLTQPQIDDLVSYLIGKPWSSSATGSLKLPPNPIAACDAKAACRAAVARWVKVEQLPASARPGAKIVSVSGCLSCHVYAGGGVRSGSAPDLTRVGLRTTTRAEHVAWLRCPRCIRRGSVMPAYAAYGDANLGRIADFLRSSRGVKG